MKRFFIFLILVNILTLYTGCYVSNNENSNIQTPSQDQSQLVPEPPVQPAPEQAPQAPSQPIVEQAHYAVAQTSWLRIRSQPSSSASVLGYLDKGDALLIEGEQGQYYLSTFKQKRAYVHKSYCQIMSIDKASLEVEKATELGSTLLGYPYVWGSQRYHWGNGVLNKNFVMGEFDCSAFVQYIYYHSNGVVLDVTTRTQVNNGKVVEKSQLARGDLMFFTNSTRKDKVGVERIAHVAIYLGNNYILHTASDHAVIEPISSTRWSYYICSRRVV